MPDERVFIRADDMCCKPSERHRGKLTKKKKKKKNTSTNRLASLVAKRKCVGDKYALLSFMHTIAL